MSNEVKEVTKKNIGQKVLGAADKTAGISAVPVKEIQKKDKFNCGTLHKEQKSIYLRFDKDVVDFDEFYSHLPTTFTDGVISVVPYTDEIISVSTPMLVCSDSKTEFKQDITKSNLSLVFNILDYLEEYGILYDQQSSFIQRVSPSRVKLHNKVVSSVNGSGSNNLVQWIIDMYFSFSEVSLVTDESEYMYECTVAELTQQAHGLLDRFLKFVQLDACPECGSSSISYLDSIANSNSENGKIYDVTKMSSYKGVFCCNDCLKYQVVSVNKIKEIFNNSPPTEINDKIQKALTVWKVLSDEEIVDAQRKDIGRNTDSGCEIEEVLFDEGVALYKFSEDRITVCIIYNNVILYQYGNPMGSVSFVEPEKYEFDLCTLCNSFTKKIAVSSHSHPIHTVNINGSLYRGHPNTSESTEYSGYEGTVLCEECMENIKDIIGNTMYQAKSREELFAKYI